MDSHGAFALGREEKGMYLFRSDVTDEAQRLIEENGFDGSYVRILSTGHSETEWINLAMLSLAERHDGIVGVTLGGLARDEVTKRIIQLPGGRVLYEILNCPRAFKVSVEEGTELPDFGDDYLGCDVWHGRLFSGGGKLIPNKNQKSPHRQARKVSENVYIELQPEFVARLGSVEMGYGPFSMESIRAMTQKAKEEGYHAKRPSLVGRILSTLRQ